MRLSWIVILYTSTLFSSAAYSLGRWPGLDEPVVNPYHNCAKASFLKNHGKPARASEIEEFVDFEVRFEFTDSGEAKSSSHCPVIVTAPVGKLSYIDESVEICLYIDSSGVEYVCSK